ncbi:MAG: aminoacyl-tRNA hydrolase [bacterium]|nr:aminoacyl-tRNA hydrolase [bacterium]
MVAGIRVIVGLGNPGSEYASTRHNVGFMAIDSIADELGVSYWKQQDGSQVGIGKRRDGEQLVLVKPLSFMNRSGGPVKAAISRYESDPGEILVIHDDIDLPEGTMRFKRGGGHGGHNGIRSIVDSIGRDFARLKIGVGRPPGRMDAADYVLQPLKGDTLEETLVSVRQAAEMAIYALDEGLDAAMQRYHTESKPAEAPKADAEDAPQAPSEQE